MLDTIEPLYGNYKNDLRVLEEVLGNRDNFKTAFPKTHRDGMEMYELHFGFKYLWEDAVDKIEKAGFRIVGFSTESWRENSDFVVKVKPDR